jgi:hypothetical protein
VFAISVRFWEEHKQILAKYQALGHMMLAMMWISLLKENMSAPKWVIV